MAYIIPAKNRNITKSLTQSSLNHNVMLSEFMTLGDLSYNSVNPGEDIPNSYGFALTNHGWVVHKIEIYTHNEGGLIHLVDDDMNVYAIASFKNGETKIKADPGSMIGRPIQIRKFNEKRKDGGNRLRLVLASSNCGLGNQFGTAWTLKRAYVDPCSLDFGSIDKCSHGNLNCNACGY